MNIQHDVYRKTIHGQNPMFTIKRWEQKPAITRLVYLFIYARNNIIVFIYLK